MNSYQNVEYAETLIGSGPHVQQLAINCLNRFGIGYYKGIELPNFLDSVLILEAIPPLSKSSENITRNNLNKMFGEYIIPNYSIHFSQDMRIIWPNIVKSTLQIYDKVRGQRILILLVYKELRNYYLNEKKERVNIPPPERTNKFCWYVFETSLITLGGLEQ